MIASRTTSPMQRRRRSRSSRRFANGAVVLMACAACLAACGGAASNVVVARVGNTIITKGAVDHWMSVVAPEHLVPDPPRFANCIARQGADALANAMKAFETVCRQQYETLKRQALGFLISSYQLVGEAAEEGLSVSQQEVEQRLAAKKHSSFPRGQVEFDAYLRETGQTASDVAFGIKGKTAAARIRERLMQTEPKVTAAQIDRYYRGHMRRFKTPERRDFDIIERLRSKADAEKLKNELRSGRSYAGMILHQSLKQPSGARGGETPDAIERAIFAAKPRVLSGPVKLITYYSLFDVTRIVPGMQLPLARVYRSIKKQLTAERWHRTLAGFVAAWRKKWIARTTCRAEYVVPICREYRASRATFREDPYMLG